MRPLTLWLLLAAVAAGDDLVVVTMPSCPPCRQLKRDLLRHPEVTRGHAVKLLEGKAAMQAHGVDMVPTIIRMRDGRQVARKVGHDGVNGLKAWLDAE